MTQEVAQYHQQRPKYFRMLVQPSEAEQTLNGFKLGSTRQINPEQQVRKALEAEAALLQQQATLETAQRQLDRSREQQQLIDTHLAHYQALARRGFVSAEDRLAWIEAVQLAGREAGLSGLEYRLTPRVASDPKLAQGLSLGQTAMILSLPLMVAVGAVTPEESYQAVDHNTILLLFGMMILTAYLEKAAFFGWLVNPSPKIRSAFSTPSRRPSRARVPCS